MRRSVFTSRCLLLSDLRFYQQVKLVNFIRRQIHQSRCYGCEGKFLSRADVLRHIAAAGHVMKLPDVSTWDQPQYYFPTYENDALLCSLSDSDEAESEETSHGEDVPVIAEDVSNLRALRQTSVLNQLLKKRS
ncbi:zinc finger protein 277 [Pleuronectes platessa]|nr:zinc finger protein 277-like [Pleuronectes platessa]XP_053282677.1 zinc finger protein 277 [Pleuronectes platessa]XP_053282678.1 zinc finger protein 277 [Pleuronectes platessa]XP_053282679.1 zinc finger protein 277-like [Pleuronectes platessa]XP_053282680.1 zinc finger protein 277 [Pleuronectes platessa]XP_053282681.1 zinc finger protein 277-like [Pleuronectes platessa]XP_053282682.1 zinc finger protein 277 [Pleuronectes platessa]XP_053282683.1 zinc finger protein 277 [Pleuronectes plates